MLKYSKILFLLILPLISSFIPAHPVSTNGNVSFTVKTVTYNGDRSPKNIVAIWVEDKDGNFVKTRLLNAIERKKWLLTWNVKSSGNVVDATTGATLSSHKTHTVTWDCTDVSGSLVEDGEYKIMVEFTEAHSQGPMTSVSFIKGPAAQTVSPANETNFTDIKLDYTPDVTGITGIPAKSRELAFYPNPFTGFTSISFSTSDQEPVIFRVYGINGSLLREMKYRPASIGEQFIQWDGKDNAGEQLPSGIYLLQIQLKNEILSGQVVKAGNR